LSVVDEREQPTALQQLGTSGTFVLAALVITVVAAAGVAIAHRNPGPPAGPAPRATVSPSPIPTVKDVASVKPVQRLSQDSARFDNTTGNWRGPTVTATRVTTPVRHGIGALEITATNPLGGSMEVWSPPVKAVAGDRYVATTYIRAITAVRGAQAELRFLDSAGQMTDTETGQLFTDSLTAWTSLPVAAIAPDGTAQVELGVSLPVVGPGAIHVIDDASIAQTPGGSTDVVPPVYALGSQIFQGNNQPLIIRGMQRFGLEGGTKTPLPTDAEIGQLKQWGANEVRISLGEQKWLNSSCHYQPGYPQQVDQVVHSVTSRGMVALINLHFAALGHCGTPGLTPMADSPGAVTFWQEVASRYADNGLVAFDLFNEPQVDQSTWLYGGSFLSGGQVYQAAGMQQLVDAVRSTGAKNLIVVSGLDFAAKPPSKTVVGGNIAYGVHAYTCSTAPPPRCTAPHPLDPAPLLDRWSTFAQSHAVLVSEFGWPNGDDGRYDASVIAYAEDHHWGWSGFAWDGGTDGLFDLVQAHPASDGTTIEPNAGGMSFVAGFARNTLVKNAS
jgi:hypothetical protein